MTTDGSSFPGGTSVTFLDVYDDAAPDGVCGGSPHMHLVSTECYVVSSGAGALQTIDPTGVRETPLSSGSVVWFTPGTIHRAVNRGDLRVVVVMSNAGLPEAGDAVMTFPADIVADPEAYARAATLAPDDGTNARAESARRRRDLAVEGFETLRAHLVRGDTRPLEDFYAAATALVRARADGWVDVVTGGPLRQAETSVAMARTISEGRSDHLSGAHVVEAVPSPGERGFGMCGRLRTYDVSDRAITALSGDVNR